MEHLESLRVVGRCAVDLFSEVASGARSRWLNSPGMPSKRTRTSGGLATRTRLTKSYAAVFEPW